MPISPCLILFSSTRLLSRAQPCARRYVAVAPKLCADAKRRIRRLELIRIKRVLTRAERAITRGTNYGPIAHSILSDSSTGICLSRPLLYEKLIELMLEHRRWEEAFGLYRRMLTEDILPESRLQSKMTAVTLFDAALGAQEPVETLQSFIVSGPADDAWFRQTVEMLMAQAYDPDLVQRLSDMYLDSRPKAWNPSRDFAIVASELQARHWDQWPRMKRELRRRKKLAPRITPQLMAEMYAKVIKDRRNPEMRTIEARKVILDRMTHLGVPLRPDIVNAFIQIDVENGEVDGAFAIYHALMAQRTLTVMPEASTYQALFSLSTKIYGGKRLMRRKYRKSPMTVPPHKLFQDMLECHLSRTRGPIANRSPVINVHAINAAVQAFLAQRDYPAALVAASLFALCKIRPNERSYETVLRHLLARARKAVRSRTADSIEWVARVLDVGKSDLLRGRGVVYGAGAAADEGASFEERVAARLLQLATDGRPRAHVTHEHTLFAVDPHHVLFSATRGPKVVTFPSLTTLRPGYELLKKAKGREGSFHWAPLLRLLHRAILPKRSYPRASVSQIVKQTRVRMIPSKKDLGFAREGPDNRTRV